MPRSAKIYSLWHGSADYCGCYTDLGLFANGKALVWGTLDVANIALDSKWKVRGECRAIPIQGGYIRHFNRRIAVILRAKNWIFIVFLVRYNLGLEVTDLIGRRWSVHQVKRVLTIWLHTHWRNVRLFSDYTASNGNRDTVLGICVSFWVFVNVAIIAIVVALDA